MKSFFARFSKAVAVVGGGAIAGLIGAGASLLGHPLSAPVQGSIGTAITLASVILAPANAPTTPK